MDMVRLWQRSDPPQQWPLSFTCDGVSHKEFMDSCDVGWTDAKGSEISECVTLIHPGTGLRIETAIRRLDDCGAIDWVCQIRNDGNVDSPLIENFVPLAAEILSPLANDNVMLRWSKGDDCCRDAFFPHDEPLLCDDRKHFVPLGGRSSNGVLPFFNVAGKDSGFVLAVGWTGQWAVDVERRANGSVHVQAGMEQTRFRLHPGESVRTPRIVLLPWFGDSFDSGHNAFRQMMLNHYVPRKNGQIAVPPVAFNSAAATCLAEKTACEADEMAMARMTADAGCEAYWVDAYWYPQPWYDHVGDWFPRPHDFPEGLAPLSSYVRELGMQFVLWFEPERVMAGTQWAQDYKHLLLELNGDPTRLVDLGLAEGRQMVVDFLDARIKEWGVDIYRQDFNMNPLEHWRQNDAPDRQGITEMKYIEGLYWVWDELTRRNPGVLIDNCASGGRRIDIETCSRSWPLWRSDFNDVNEGHKGPAYYPFMGCADQVHVSGLSLYVPLHAGPVWGSEPYVWRSAMSSSVVLYGNAEHFDPALTRQAVAELNELRPLFTGDFYPLMPFSLEQTGWSGYQFHHPARDQGFAVFFRRPECAETSVEVALRCIDPEASYRVEIRNEAYQSTNVYTCPGHDLLPLSTGTDKQPGSVLVMYQRV